MLGLLLTLLVPSGASAEVSLQVRRWLLPGQPLHLEVQVTEVPSFRRERFFLLVDGLQVRTADLDNGTHSLRFDDLGLAPGRHEIVLQSGHSRGSALVQVLPWWGVVSGLVLPVTLLLLVLELLRRRRRSRPA